MKPRSEPEQGRGEKEPHNKNKNKCVSPTMTIDCVQLASFARLWIFSICLTEIILCCSTHQTICDFRVFLHSISMLFIHSKIERGNSNGSHETTCAPFAQPWYGARRLQITNSFFFFVFCYGFCFSSSSILVWTFAMEASVRANEYE